MRPGGSEGEQLIGADPAGPPMAESLAQAGGDPAWLAAADEGDAVATLVANCAEAESLGVFGVPTVVLGNEIFWGVDALPTLAWTLERRA